MKNLFIFGAILALAISAFAADEAGYQVVNCTNYVAAGSTNSTASSVYELYDGQQIVRIRMSAQAVGSDATSGKLTMRFVTACGAGAPGSSYTNSYDTAATSIIQLTMTNISSSAATTASDWFVVSGARFIKEGVIENSFGQAVTNISAWIESNRSQR